MPLLRDDSVVCVYIQNIRADEDDIVKWYKLVISPLSRISIIDNAKQKKTSDCAASQGEVGVDTNMRGIVS